MLGLEHMRPTGLGRDEAVGGGSSDLNWWLLPPQLPTNGQSCLPQRPDSEGGDLSAKRREGGKSASLGSPWEVRAVCKQPGTGKGEQLLMWGVVIPGLGTWLGEPNCRVNLGDHYLCLLYTSDAADDWLVV